MSKPDSKMVLGAVLYPNFELLDLYGPLEMFGCVGPELKIVTVSDEPGPVASAQGPLTLSDYAYEECPGLDLMLVPGGVGTFGQLENAKLIEFLQKKSVGCHVTMSVCSGSGLLARAGLLDDRRATSNKQFFDFSVAQSDRAHWVPEARWVEDGPVATSSGVSAGIDMSLAIIARLFGREKADEIAIMTEYEWHDDPARDPFSRYLNQGDATRLLATFSGNDSD